MKTIYAIFALIGIVLPYYYFLNFVNQYGFHLKLMYHFMFGNRVSGFLSAALIFASLMVWVFILADMRKKVVKLWWIAFIGNLIFSASFGLPFYLFLKEYGKEN
ncbi:MAG TPA: DUF2834 domain-containing protein [Candidatus Cloacimonadota bacterium]|nr:DUF2834 domain-containing protein [Candidatus Cloacimonadota bacterium]HPT71004.1 DUF2834 domain-containing protein [Candidatus Cloacimonadota bacterium]